jgi:hypothetical protein
MDDGGAIGEWAAAETTAACGGACEGACVRRRAANANDVGERLRGDSGGVLRQRRRRRMRQRRRRRRRKEEEEKRVVASCHDTVKYDNSRAEQKKKLIR